MDEAQQQLDQLLHNLKSTPKSKWLPWSDHEVQRHDDVPSAWSSTVTPRSASLWRSWSDLVKSFCALALLRSARTASTSAALTCAPLGARSRSAGVRSVSPMPS